jgi:hypothetical protein
MQIFLPKHLTSNVQRRTSNLGGHVALGPVIVLAAVLEGVLEGLGRQRAAVFAKAAVTPGQRADMRRPANGRYSGSRALSFEDRGELLLALLELAQHGIGDRAIHLDVPGVS